MGCHATLQRVVVSAEQAEEAALHASFAARILAFGRCHLRDIHAARDLVQQVLLIVLESLRAGSLREPEKLASFVLGTCRNVVHDWKRTGQRRQDLLGQHAELLLPAPLAPDMASLDRERLTGCLDGLAARERSVITMTFYEDLDASEVARALSMAPGHVRVVRHRALARLRECMGEES